MQEGLLPLYTAQDEKLDRLEALVYRLMQDGRVGLSLMGAFTGAPSAQTLRRVDGMFYQSGSVGVYPVPSTLSIVANCLYATPFYMPGSPNFMDEIAIEVTQVSTGNVRLGIYEDDGSLHPGRLISDVGTVAVGLQGGKKLTVNKTTPKGLKWLALVTNAATLRTTAILPSAGSWNLLGCGPTNLNTHMVGWWDTTFTYAALPANFPTGAKCVSTPCIYLSFKSGGWS